MALTAEQQADLDMQIAMERERETLRNSQAGMHRKMELVRIAKDILVENSRSKDVSEREVTASDITTYADTLLTYVNS